MPDCELLKTCPYFKDSLMEEFDVVAEMRRQKYCRGDNSICARYMVFKALGRENVPKDLIPSQAQEAKELIDKSQKKKE